MGCFSTIGWGVAPSGLPILTAMMSSPRLLAAILVVMKRSRINEINEKASAPYKGQALAEI